MAGRVIAFPGVSIAEPEPPRKPPTSTPCPVCSYPISSEDSYDLYDCTRCRVVMHGACYWGRVAALEEWVAYIRRVLETEDEFSAGTICAACRQLDGLGK